ncbi:MAG: metallopeptidase [Candidatus Aenigmarchaeota archaeon]|nr:metallopeptidase [Candidatus Aenigmarchaeota archaeon]
MRFEPAPDLEETVSDLVKTLQFSHIKTNRLRFFRSHGSKSRAIARIWNFPKIWQAAMGIEAHYIIEVVSEAFDKLEKEEKEKVLLHELIHIPKSFSGALLSHNRVQFDGKGGLERKRIDSKTVEALYKQYKNLKKSSKL